jgi:two-component system, chemotaxis family, CheB/CheR fusion protein
MSATVPTVTFEQMLSEFATRHKLDLRGYKFTTLRRRTKRRMEQLRIPNYDAYLKYVEQNPAEVTELLYTVLINVTKFFRDGAAWQALRDDVLPELLRHHVMGERLKVWCAGCSTGEEAYSVALLVADYFGPHLKDNDVKIYATDQDDQALQVARKGEYKTEALSGIPQAYRRFLTIGPDTFRLEREVRRLVIFGRSNIISDAPISHVDLLICRNLLIYFEQSAQRHIMGRLRYAVDPGGVLFLGKSESQLRSSEHFVPINSRWRIFRRTNVPSPLERPGQMNTPNTDRGYLNERAQQELELLKAYHEAVLDTLEPAVLILDAEGTVIRENDSVRRLWQSEAQMLGGKIDESALLRNCPDMKARLDGVRSDGSRPVSFNCSTPEGKELNVVIRPIMAENAKDHLGTLIYMEDVSPQENLQQTVEELQTTAEELQSTNEELETTNEELQSTNEELETTNEELQSTNEELETTNEELKSLNEELEDINEELAKRSRQLDEFSQRYSEMVEQMPWPLVLARADGTINVYNTAAQKMFGFAKPSPDGMNLRQMPMTGINHEELAAHIRRGALSKENILVENFQLSTNSGKQAVRIHIRPMPVGEAQAGALVMFEPLASGSAARSISPPKKAEPKRLGRVKASSNGRGKPALKKNKTKRK